MRSFTSYPDKPALSSRDGVDGENLFEASLHLRSYQHLVSAKRPSTAFVAGNNNESCFDWCLHDCMELRATLVLTVRRVGG